MRRKLVLVALVAVACAVVALAALPWWLGAALRVGGRSFGLTFGEYQRIGYTRFVLTDVVVRRPGVDVKVSLVELGAPLMWMVRRPGEVAVGHWSVAVTPTDAPKDKAQPEGWRPLRAQLGAIVAALDRWLPPATAGAGEISWPGETLRMSGAEWDKAGGPRLLITGLTWREEVAEVSIKSDAPVDRLIVEANAADGRWEATLESEDSRILGRGLWWGQPLSYEAWFAKTGWIPVDAKVGAVDWQLPAARLKLNAFYETISGRAEVILRDGVLTVDARAEGKPLSDNEAPPLHVQLHGSGGWGRLSIDRLDLQVPGVEGHLTEPIEIGRDGQLLSGASRFDLTVDLAKQPWFNGRGQVNGVVEIIPQGERAPLVGATLTTANATVDDWVITEAAVDANLEWPVLRVKTATVKLADGDELALGGEWNTRSRTLAQGRIQGRVSRGTVARWLTTDAEFETLEVDATAAGAWPLVKHEGRAKAVGLRVSPLRALALDAQWNGTGRLLDSVAIDAVAGGTRLNARGSVATDSVRIDELVFSQAEAERLRLVAPARVQWSPSITTDELRLKGPEGEVVARLEWGEVGEVKLDVKNVSSSWLAEIVELPDAAWSVTSLAVEGRWDRGPLVFTATGESRIEVDEGRRVDLVLSARGDADGVQVETLRVSMDERQVARANGRLPVTLYPGRTPWLKVDETAALSLDAATEPNAFFWEQLSTLTGLVVTDPEVRVTMTGTLKKPVGEATLRIAKLTPDDSGRLRGWPEIERLDARLTGDSTGVALETFTMNVAGQAVRASGRLPVTQWTALMEDPLGLAKVDGEAHIEIPDADVAALARYAPAYLAPTGTLQVDVSLAKGGQLKGVVRLKDAATRPLGPLGTLQSVGAEIVLNGRTIEFKHVRASTGGQPVTLSGKVKLADGKQPRLDLALRGDNLPFVRQAGLLVRGDVDLRLVTDDAEVTHITGTTRLRDSFFLMDVRALIPKGGARNGPGRRPPYFAVEVPPFDEWRLDVAVDGDRFLRLRTPLFAGLASAHFRLRGTLADPRATGEAVVNYGRVLLPFAVFTVLQGDVRLTETNPFEPGISLIGTSRRYGYDLRMEVSGTVDKPRVMFSSTPPLESEQVLLMVMTGETPQNEVSYTGREKAARLGAYLGQSLIKQLGGDPQETDRLSVSVGERISRQGRETYGVEYELNPRWSLVGEYDEFDEYNLGIKWRIWSDRKREEENDARK